MECSQYIYGIIAIMDELTSSVEESEKTDESQVDVEDLKGEVKSGDNRKIVVVIAAIALVTILIVMLGVWGLMQNSQLTEQIRDIFIIFMALESLLVGIVLIILVIQLARLINLLQNEVKPILESTNETVSTLRGTTVFLSDHMVEPIIKLNSYLAALQSLVGIFNLTKGKK